MITGYSQRTATQAGLATIKMLKESLFPRFRYAYPFWGSIHIFSICVTILLKAPSFFRSDQNIIQDDEYRDQQQKQPRSTRYSYADEYQEGAEVNGVS